jgi:DNA polymerase-1
MVKVALTNIDNYIVTNNLRSKIVLTVHDEIVVDVPPTELDCCVVFKKLMKEAGDMFLNNGIEMEVEDVISDYWTK